MEPMLMDTIELYKDFGSTAILIGMAWYLLRNLVTKQNETQEKIINTLVTHDTVQAQNWAEHKAQMRTDNNALIEATNVTVRALDAVVRKMNGMQNE